MTVGVHVSSLCYWVWLYGSVYCCSVGVYSIFSHATKNNFASNNCWLINSWVALIKRKKIQFFVVKLSKNQAQCCYQNNVFFCPFERLREHKILWKMARDAACCPETSKARACHERWVARPLLVGMVSGIHPAQLALVTCTCIDCITECCVI